MEKLTVAICTRNRAAVLDETLAALAAAAPPRDAAWEVLVVLNACSDDSPAVAERWRGRLPLVTASEPTPGVSHARNAAVAAAGGTLILWMDDDVTVGPGWLRAYEAAAARWPETWFFGGAIHPRFVGTPPPWLVAALPAIAGAFGAHPGGADGAPVEAGNTPFSGNLAVRMAAQRRHRFDPTLGRGPVGWQRGGEEAAFLETLVAEGVAGRWIAGADVEHRIGAQKQTRRFVHVNYYGFGRDRGLAARRLAEDRRRAAAPGADPPPIVPPEVLRRLYPPHSERGALLEGLMVIWAELLALPPRLSGNHLRWARRRARASERLGYWRGRYGG